MSSNDLWSQEKQEKFLSSSYTAESQTGKFVLKSTSLSKFFVLRVQARKIQKIASGAGEIIQFSGRACEIVASQISACGAPKINARLKFMHSYICVLKIMRAMWTRQDAKGATVAQFSRALFTATAIMQIYFRSTRADFVLSQSERWFTFSFSTNQNA